MAASVISLACVEIQGTLDKLTLHETVRPHAQRLPQKKTVALSVPSQSDVDVQSLVKQLTLQEKVSLLAGDGLWHTAAVKRLGIPRIKVTDGPNGARGELFTSGTKAACFPAAVSIAATWDTGLAKRIGRAMAEETKTKGASVLTATTRLGPTVCPHRSPLGGRNFESFSEDPLLAGLQAASVIQGLQENGIAATIKHFAANEQETMRNAIDVVVSERALREIYLKPFEIAIKQAKPLALMTSYNLVNGVHADQNTHLVKEILHEQWGYDGLVMSDYGGTNSLEDTIKTGVDLEMPGPPRHRTLAAVEKALASGSLDMASIDDRVRSVLQLVKNVGKFEHPDEIPETAVNHPDHQRLIREAGADGIVLLKNKGGILPLQTSSLSSIAVLGQSKTCFSNGGGSANLNAHYKITPYEALQKAVGETTELRYAIGAQIYRKLPCWTSGVTDHNGQPGWTMLEYDVKDKNVPLSDDMQPQRVYAFPQTTYMAIEHISDAVRLEGTFTPASSGAHYFSLPAFGHAKLFIDGELAYDAGPSPDPRAFSEGGPFEEKKQHHFVQGKSYQLRVEVLAPKPEQAAIPMMAGRIMFHLGFMAQEDYEEDVVTSAVEAAKRADVALVFVGNSAEWETEGHDAANMSLPAFGSQDRLIEAVAAVNPRTVVINCSGVPVAMPWIDSVAGLLQCWYQGQEAGNAIVDVLLGAVSPSGRLPVSFPRSVEDTPSYGNFPGDLATGTVNYAEGIKVGYRHYDKHPDKVLFPFGAGLSYTSFEFGPAVITPRELVHGGFITVRLQVKNVGAVAGKEVVQVYLAPLPTEARGADRPERPIKVLAGFSKVAVAPQSAVSAAVEFSFESAAFWDEKADCWAVDCGEYAVLVGNSSVNHTKVGTIVVNESFTYGP
ncbi:hypothetical protein SCUCBS95973_003007 [Sporothrix curviconia]|uniref:beta-glucosidase n=1 Tax=Sporothrix curviconia TaxID=1260050 RepID=A0ABP0BBM7_9PEZI